MNATNRLSRSFHWLNATQFFGALNDNIFQLLVTFFLIHQLPGARKVDLSALAGLVFAVPFLLFTPAAGILADRTSKSRIVVWAKVLEIGAMTLGVAAFASGHAGAAYAVLFLMGAQSALFGPAKYGILPELVHREQLSRANAFIVAFTYLSIIFGTTLGSSLTDAMNHRFAQIALICVGVAVVGTLTSLGIKRTPPAGSTERPSLFFFMNVWRTLRAVRGDRFLILAIFGAAYFSLIGAFLKFNLIPFGMDQLGLEDAKSGYLFLAAALGIGCGALITGRMSGRNIEFGVVPLGAIILALGSIALYLSSSNVPCAATAVLAIGIGSGLFIVPLDAFIQARSPRDKLGEVIAAKGFLDWIGILFSTVIMLSLGALHLSPAQGFLVMGALTLVLTIVAIKLLPDFLVRFIAIVITRCIYRIKAIGVENLPAEGGALLVSNHVSFMDALQIMACQQRRIRFMMHRSIYENSPMKALFKLMGVIPIAMEDPPKRIIESLHAARQSLDDGYTVCIFAEGALTRNGLMRGFKPGFERIVKGSAYPIIPIYIGGSWGSLFSHYYGKQHARIPAKFPYPVTILFGKPMPATSKAIEVRQAILELSCEYFEDLKASHKSLARSFVGTARANWGKHAISDTTGQRLSYGRALAGAVALAGELGKIVGGQERVGVLLPTTAGGALTNIAIALRRQVAVNLNFTASKEAFQYAIQQAELQTIITSRAFLEKMPEWAGLPGLVYLEDIFPKISGASKLYAWVRARLAPASWLAPARGGRPDDVATIIFSSGTTGEPKGVMLSHHNILSNIESLGMVFRPKRHYTICAALPLFHSFGYTCGLWFPLLTGMAASYHANPLDGSTIARVIREDQCTALFATPTFLLAYLRRAERDDFKSLLHVVVGAEKLRSRVADAFEEKFGIRPLEGFGATELSPVAALSLPDVEITGIVQAGTKPGSVGQPVPGVAVRIVDPETYAGKPPGEPGLLLVKGPNVMLGYLGKPELTAAALRDGWYSTGDIATVDADGFITITDRLARFSKIGGEMVPHVAIEEEYLKGLNKSEAVLAVASVPDEKKGEKLVVLFTLAAGDPDALRGIMEQSNIPNLWKPGRNNYFQIEKLPLTGSGKLDVKTLRQMARTMSDAPQS